MTSRTSDFTGSDGATWPLSSGSWTHTTDLATVGSPGNVINSNRGRARVAAATTISSRRAHHADYTNFKENSVEVRATFTSDHANIVPCLFLKTSGTTAFTDRYIVRVIDNATEAKSLVGIYKYSGGGETTLASQDDSATALTLPSTVYIAFRAIQLASTVKLQAKVWTGTEPDYRDTDGGTDGSDYTLVTTTDSTSGIWDTDGGVGIGEHYNYDPTVQTDAFWDDFSATSIEVIAPDSIASTVSFGTPSVATGAATIAPSSITSTVAFGTPTVTPGPVSITPDSIASTLSFGTPTVTTTGMTIAPLSIESTLAFGTPTLTPGAVSLAPSSITSTLAFGSVTVARIDPDGNPYEVVISESGVTILEPHTYLIRETSVLELR